MINIRKIKKSEMQSTLRLIEQVFMKFEAPDYSIEGISTFQNLVLNNPSFLNKLEFIGAFHEEKIIGVIATRNNKSHIALFFVHENHQKQGIGKRLFKAILDDTLANEITVNSSPYAVKVYERLCFKSISDEKIEDGMRYTPMRYIIKN